MRYECCMFCMVKIGNNFNKQYVKLTYESK